MAETASATLSSVQIDSTTFQYSITLNDTGTPPLGTFWFAWDDLPDQDFMASTPLSVTPPTGWSGFITHGGATDGYGIEFIAGGGAALQAGHTLAGFTFTSHVTPSAMAGQSVIDPSFAATSSFVYQGGAFSDAGFNFVVTCFAAGTRIRTPRGNVPVETLRVGEPVQTIDGTCRLVTWMGRRAVDCRRHARPAQVWPIRVAAHAFGRGMPIRPLYLSPNHAVFVDDVLVPVRHLVNDTSIAQVRVDRVEYYHVELDCHDVLLAEGLPAESYLDTGDRATFENGVAPLLLHPEFATLSREAACCAPLVISGPILARIRRRLDETRAASGQTGLP